MTKKKFVFLCLKSDIHEALQKNLVPSSIAFFQNGFEKSVKKGSESDKMLRDI
jgi:hypothetical protein